MATDAGITTIQTSKTISQTSSTTCGKLQNEQDVAQYRTHTNPGTCGFSYSQRR
jgi:hypothetical protein